MSTHNVNVSGIAPTTTEAHLHDFFTFCGKIIKIEFTPESKAAVVQFEKPSAAKTALMLNGGSLDGAELSVTSDVDHQDTETAGAPEAIEQTDKPRTAIAAEYIATGYKLSDSVLQRAIEIDNKQGISKKFLTYFNQFDKTVGERALGKDQTLTGKLAETLTSATAQARSVDEKKGYTKVAHDYYSKAMASPWGAQVFSFYTSTSKQILDIHAEARRIADQHKQNTGAAPSAAAPATSTPAQ
ncbi:hypothetical protein FIBSPDRAFT_887407 [Athelia psychrophila]|uniref:RRM domain-containing protein n=1 Tax=Athelia psychrophila TaxID=1759441 RepID=A0A166PQ31_9AGAM|nr:hypothetical protein FIBSPDRAFT_887407 [Fibularhizoctonia sp. CBS 109695]